LDYVIVNCQFSCWFDNFIIYFNFPSFCLLIVWLFLQMNMQVILFIKSLPTFWTLKLTEIHVGVLVLLQISFLDKWFVAVFEGAFVWFVIHMHPKMIVEPTHIINSLSAWFFTFSMKVTLYYSETITISILILEQVNCILIIFRHWVVVTKVNWIEFGALQNFDSVGGFDGVILHKLIVKYFTAKFILIPLYLSRKIWFLMNSLHFE